ncbi:MAG: tetratricopeptide repeat protein [Mucilaginibacter sp.]
MRTLVNELKRLYEIKDYDAFLRLLVASGEDCNPSNADTAYLGMLVFERMGHLPQALARAQTWLKNDPQNVHFLRFSGGLLYRLDRHKEALETLLRAQQIMPDPRIHVTIAEIISKSKTAPDKPQSQTLPKNKSQLKTPSNIQKIHIFIDEWADTIGICIWAAQMALIVISYIVPYRAGIHNHPVLPVLAFITKAMHPIHISSHAWLVVGLIMLTLIGGMIVQDRICKPGNTEVVVFDGVRKIYSYHWEWLLFFMSTAACLYTNTDHFIMNNKGSISAALGMVAIATGLFCLYLLVPGARPRMLLIRTVTNKGNRIVILRGVLFQSVVSYLAQQIVSPAVIKKSPMWLFSFTSNVDIELDNGQILRIMAPGSIVETRGLTHLINTAINDAKIINNQRHTENIYGGR